MNQTFVLNERGAVERLRAFLDANWGACARDGQPLVVNVARHRARRSVEQNARLHALLRDIAENAWVDGRQYSAQVWKEWFKARFLGTDDGPGGMQIPRATSRLTVGEMAEFMTHIEAYAASALGVELHAAA